MAKRTHEDIDVDAIVQEIETSLSGDDDAKLAALQGLKDSVDTADEGYEVQRAAAAAGVLGLLMALLGDDSEAVRVEAAKALAVLTKHSTAAMARLDVGKTTGFSQTPEKVSLNPVQQSVSELDGLFNLLTNMKFADVPELQQAATAALTAVCALNRPNTTEALRELVHRLLQHEPKALEALEGMLAGLDVRDDIAVLLDQALSPTLTFLRSGEPGERLDAVTLLGSITEKRRGAAAFLVAEGALPPVAALLLTDDIAARDAAAHTLWLLVRDNKRLLSPAKDALGCPGTKLVDPLLALVAAAQREEAEEDEEGVDDDEPVTDAGENAVDNGDDALLLLRALAGHDQEVKEKLGGQSEVLGARCTIM